MPQQIHVSLEKVSLKPLSVGTTHHVTVSKSHYWVCAALEKQMKPGQGSITQKKREQSSVPIAFSHSNLGTGGSSVPEPHT